MLICVTDRNELPLTTTIGKTYAKQVSIALIFIILNSIIAEKFANKGQTF